MIGAQLSRTDSHKLLQGDINLIKKRWKRNTGNQGEERERGFEAKGNKQGQTKQPVVSDCVSKMKGEVLMCQKKER